MTKDLDKKIIELMDLFDGEVTTADKIDRPERALEKEAIDDFMKRNPMAGGGMLVQPSANGSRPGYAGDDEKHIYTRKSGAKRLIFGDKVYGSVSKGDKKGLEELKKKRDKLIADGVVKPRVEYDLELLKNQWRKTLPTKKATTWENFLKTKFPKGSTTPNTIRKRTETAFRKGESDFNAKEEFRVNVKEKQNLKKLEQVKKLVKAHNDSDKFLYDKKTIYKKLGFEGAPQIFKKDLYKKTSVGKVYKSLINEAIVNEANKLMPIEQKITNAFDKIVNENKKIYEPKGGTKVKKAGILKRMISDIVSPKGSVQKYQVSTRAISDALSTHQPYLDIKNNFDYLEQNLARKMKGNTFNEAMDYAKYVRGGLDMKNIEKFSANYRLPESNVIKFALRSAFNNYKAGNTDPPVRIFNLKADGTPGKEVDFGKLKIDYSTNMKAIDINKIGFTYENQFFTKKDLRTKGFESGLFDEVYKLTAKGNMRVPNPNNPNGPDITLNKLLNLNKDKLTLGHNDAKGGITKLPFTDLRLEGNKINSALYNGYNKIKNKSLRKLVVNKLQGDFGFLNGDDYERAFIEGEQNKATNIGKKNITERTLYKQAGRDVITDLGQDLLKQKESFQTEAFRVAGIGKKEEQTILNNLQAKSKLKECQISLNAEGGRIGFANSIKCIEDGLNETRKAAGAGDKKAARQLVETAEAASKGGRLLKNVLGPGAILGEAVFEGALIGNRLLEGKPLDQAWAESYLSYLDPRKYAGQLDPRLMERERMLTRTLEDEEGNVIRTMDGPNANLLRAGFAAQDQLSFANEAAAEAKRAKTAGRMDEYFPAAADAREQAARANLSANIISSDAFKDATTQARQYLDAQEGKRRFPLRQFKESIGKFESQEAKNYRQQKEKEMQNLYTQFSDTQLMDMLENSKSLKAAGITPEQYMSLLGAGTKRITPAVTRTLSGLDAVRTDIQEQEALNRIAEAGGVANLARGGRAGFKLGKLAKLRKSKVREDAKAIIDESMKMQQEIDTTTELDKLIKKTLDEDLFDKKDRIVDSINISEAKKRRNYPYNMQVFEEPKNLDFYRDIKESNFRTKTGPYYDRIRRLNKAGGGILKEAGDSSGPPPESGPMSQGLQGLMKRGMKI